MKLKFFWRSLGSSLFPACTSDVVDRDGISALCSVLVDDGGLSTETVLLAIRDGLEKIDAVRAGATSVAYWSREEWSVEIRSDHVEMGTHEEDVEPSTMVTESFRKALVAWQSFLMSHRDPNEVHEVEV